MVLLKDSAMASNGLALSSVFIITEHGEGVRDLSWELARNGFACSALHYGEEALKRIQEQIPTLIIVEIDSQSTHSTARELCQKLKQERQLPVIALVSREMVSGIEADTFIDDFVVKPCDVAELTLRASRLLHKLGSGESDDLIRCGDLMIDPAKCEVTLGGQRIALAFKEYELLKFLAKNKGRVFTREALLNEVWGYDYFGGDRTVDVHIRRLRSKIEISGRFFIETVRNIGYRLCEGLCPPIPVT